MRFVSVRLSLMTSAESMDPPDRLALQVLLDVEVAYAEPAQQWVVPLSLPEGATVADALAEVAQREPFSRLELSQMAVGVFGEVVAPSQVLQAFDRVELYRPLHQDPKAARRLRAEQNR